MNNREEEKVSVIIPYIANDEFLVAMREMIREQTYKNIEPIFIRDESRRGASWARNRGLAIATGSIILFADVDDEITRDWVANMVASLGDADFAFAGFTLATGDSREVILPHDGCRELAIEEIKPYFFASVFGYRLRDMMKLLSREGIWRGCNREWAGVWRLAIRRDRFATLQFEESLRLYEDAMFISSLAMKSRVVKLVGDCGYTWIVRDTGSMEKLFRERKCEQKFLVRDVRRKIDPKMNFWRGTFVLSAIEIFKEFGFREAWNYLCFRDLPKKD